MSVSLHSGFCGRLRAIIAARARLRVLRVAFLESVDQFLASRKHRFALLCIAATQKVAKQCSTATQNAVDAAPVQLAVAQ